MAVQPYQTDPNCKHSHMTCSAGVQRPIDVYGIDTSINTQMLKTPHDILFHLADLYNVIKPYIGKIKKEKGYIFSEFFTESFKVKLLWYVNEFLFEMIKTALKDKYLGVTTTTTLKNEVATWRKIYYDKENQVMINQSVNEFYNRFLFKIDVLPQEVGSPFDITAIFFNTLRPDVREFLISEGVQVPQRLPTETNH